MKREKLLEKKQDILDAIYDEEDTGILTIEDIKEAVDLLQLKDYKSNNLVLYPYQYKQLCKLK